MSFLVGPVSSDDDEGQAREKAKAVLVEEFLEGSERFQKIKEERPLAERGT